MANRAWRAGLISSLFLNLLFSGVAACLSGSQIRITVHNDARIPESVLTQAAGEASKYSESRRGQVWIVCPYSNAEQSAPQDCLSPADLSHVSLRVVPWSSRLGDSIFGMAFLSEKGEGAYGDVFILRQRSCVAIAMPAFRECWAM